MKIGYPCINTSLKCTSGNTFRLRNYSEQNLICKISRNLSCLQKILEFNRKHNILFFRISSDIIPFASHPICKFNWKKYFKKELKFIGAFIKKHKMRISMHPDQFVLLNAKDEKIVKSSISELRYHVDLLDAMGLDYTAKVQIHVGGVYGDKTESINRFIDNYKKLSSNIKNRLVIENDDKSYTLKDCIYINSYTGIPVVFDVLHHELNNNGENIQEVMKAASKTWKKKDGKIIVHYSSQKPGARKGTHADILNGNNFNKFIRKSKSIGFDIMLEVKNKERSTMRAIEILGKERNK